MNKKKVLYRELTELRKHHPQFEEIKNRLDKENRTVRQRNEELRKENESVKRELAKLRVVEKDLLEQTGWIHLANIILLIASISAKLPLILENLRMKEAIECMQKVYNVMMILLK